MNFLSAVSVICVMSVGTFLDLPRATQRTFFDAIFSLSLFCPCVFLYRGVRDPFSEFSGTANCPRLPCSLSSALSFAIKLKLLMLWPQVEKCFLYEGRGGGRNARRIMKCLFHLLLLSFIRVSSFKVSSRSKQARIPGIRIEI